MYSVDGSLPSSRASDRMRLTAEDFLLCEVVVAIAGDAHKGRARYGRL